MADNAWLEEVGKLIGAATAAVGALVGGAAVIRRRLVRDQTETIKDRAEGDFVVTLLKERDEAQADARTAWEARQKDTELIGRLTSQTEYQRQEIERLKKEFAAFKRQVARLYPDARAFVQSDFAPPDLDPLPPSK